MSPSEKLQASDFTFFIDEMLRPELDLYRNWHWRFDWPTRNRSLAAHFELFGWLYLGVQIGFFAREGANSILNHFSSELLESPSEVSGLFPELRVAAERARTMRGIPRESKPDFVITPELFLNFRSMLVAGSAFAGDSVTHPFTTALTFSSEPIWKDLMTLDQLEPDEVLKLLEFTGSEPLPVTKETVVAGFIKSLRHLDRFREIVNQSDAVSAKRDVAEFFRRIRQIIGWRVNLRYRKSRFDEIGNIVNLKINKELLTSQLQDDKFFLRELEDLAKTWLGDSGFQEHPMAVSVRR
jgi:hypothetical protein